MQEEMDRVTTELEEKEYKATSGGDAVEAVVTGKMELKTLTVKPEVVDPEDVEMLEDMVAAAVNEAVRVVDAASDAAMQAITGGANFPGL